MITMFFLIACNQGEEALEVFPVNTSLISKTEAIENPILKSIKSEYDISTVDKDNSTEFKESLLKIELEFGEQWSFCDCVIKGDSINSAFMNTMLSDSEFDRLAIRLDEIDEKCQAFRIQSPSLTPEDREKHKKKVSQCLKNYGKFDKLK